MLSSRPKGVRRGQGNASATITAVLVPSGDGTKVEVVTDLNITGKVAQFGRGVLVDVSGKLLDQFVHNLETTVLGGPEPESAQTATPPADTTVPPAARAASTGPFPIDHPEPEPVDLAAVAGGSLARRVLPFASIAGILVLIRIVIYALKRRKR